MMASLNSLSRTEMEQKTGSHRSQGMKLSWWREHYFWCGDFQNENNGVHSAAANRFFGQKLKKGAVSSDRTKSPEHWTVWITGWCGNVDITAQGGNLDKHVEELLVVPILLQPPLHRHCVCLQEKNKIYSQRLVLLASGEISFYRLFYSPLSFSKISQQTTSVWLWCLSMSV